MILVHQSSGVRLLLALAVIPSLATASCAARTAFVAPVGPGGPAPDAAAAWDGATASCRSTTSYRAGLGLTGRVGERRIRGLASAKLYAAVTAEGAIGLEASVSGQLLFKLGGTSDEAQLLLRDPSQVVSARPEDILEALIGVTLTPDRLLAILAGCVSRHASFERAEMHPGVLQIVTADATVFLNRQGSGWQPLAGRFADLTVEYGAFADGLPRDVYVGSIAGRIPAVSLTLKVQEVAVNTEISPTAFRVVVPDGAQRISLDELRRTGPLADDVPER